MGRHETFQDATPIAEELLGSTALGRLQSEAQLVLTSREACPLFAIGAQIGRLVAEHSRQDHRSIEAYQSGSRDEKLEAERGMERAQSAIDLLCEAASYQQATSLEGAMTHVIAAAGAIGDVRENSGLDEEARKERLDTALRCLNSIAKTLSAFTGLSIRSLGADYLLPVHLDKLGMAWTLPRASYCMPGPKPTVDDGSASDGSSIERQLMAINRSSTEWWSAYELAGDLETEAEEHRAAPGAAVKKGMGEMAAAHATRIVRANLIRAMELPATSVRELGLQARLVAVELNEWWARDEQEAGETACRQLLTRLIALAGLTHIPRKDLEVAEALDWISNPLDYASRYRRHESVHESYNRTLPKEA